MVFSPNFSIADLIALVAVFLVLGPMLMQNIRRLAVLELKVDVLWRRAGIEANQQNRS